MTCATFRYLDRVSLSQHAYAKAWTKVDVAKASYNLVEVERPVHDLRGREAHFTVDNSGFAVYNYPTKVQSFDDEKIIRSIYYKEVEQMLRCELLGVSKVVVFDHTIRRTEKASPRKPVQLVHVDQTPAAAEARVRRHVSDTEMENLMKGRYQIINVWRPIENVASDFPLAVVDWRTTSTDELIPVDLLYPKRVTKDLSADSDNDDRGKEVVPDHSTLNSTEGYEIKGEQFGVAPSDEHEFYYMKDMTPDEAMFIKCYDSRGHFMPDGTNGVAMYSPHSAFIDPQTPEGAPGRQSIEVRCLVFFN